ncbi:hypothetical protein ACEU6E_02660 [Halorutilales archaeon Cl-col2-1]|nr:hypothetical protein [Halobacteria archaeon]
MKAQEHESELHSPEKLYPHDRVVFHWKDGTDRKGEVREIDGDSVVLLEHPSGTQRKISKQVVRKR